MIVEYDLANIPLRIRRILNKCSVKAKLSQMHSKHCACLEKDGKIYMFSVNDYTNISYSNINKFSYHAEEKLLKNFYTKGRKKYNLYIIRISPDGKRLVNSKPCNDCIKIINSYSPIISKVFYSTDDNSILVERPSKIKSGHLSIGNSANNGYL